MSGAEPTTTRRTILASGGAGLAMITSGCTGITRAPPIDDVVVQLSGIREPDVGICRFTLPLELAFTNTGNTTIPAVGIEAQTYINGTPVGYSQASVGSISAGDTVESLLTNIVRYDDVSNSIIDALRQGAFVLQVSGTMQSDGLLIDAAKNFEARVQVG